LKTAEVSEARLEKDWAHAVADAEAEAEEDSDGLAELAMVVGVSVCVEEKDAEPAERADALRDSVIDTLETTVELIEDDTSVLLCTLEVLLEMIVAIVEEGVAYGGRSRFGVAVGQPSMHGVTSFAPRT
jgi:hypothetical protein